MFGLLKNLFGSNNRLKEALAAGAYLVDVRTPQEYASGSVPGAVNIPLSTITSKITAFKNKPAIVVFCRSGMRSGQAKAILEQHGIQNVVNGGPWGQVMQAMEIK